MNLGLIMVEDQKLIKFTDYMVHHLRTAEIVNLHVLPVDIN